jgi:pimeloyl-ACP methyl ester carboxylesterase
LARAARASAHRRSIAHELGAITARTLVVSGEEDLAIPPALAREVQQQIRGATLRSFAATGHAVMLERPAEFNELLLEFLAA